MAKKLNLDTFNDILFEALKDQSTKGKIEMIEAELTVIANLFYEDMSVIFDELDASGYESPKFNEVKNLKNNSEHLLEQLEQLKKEVEEDDKR